MPIPRLLPITPGHPDRDLMADGRALRSAGVTHLLLREAGRPVDALERLVSGLEDLGLVVVVHARCGPVRRGVGRHLAGHADVAAARGAWPGLLGRSVHSVAEAREALAAGADYALLGPVWAPGSKPQDHRPPLGPHVFSALRGLPVLALGGVDAARAVEAVRAGAHGVAVIGGVFGGVRGVEASAASLVAALEAA